jgi:hypothetical protein
MDKYYNYLEYIDNIIPITNIKPIINNLDFTKIVGGRFISKKIQEEILTQNIYKYYEFNYNYNQRSKIKGKIIFGIINNNLPKIIKKLEIVSKILIFLALISSKKKDLLAYIFLSKHKKISNGHLFDPENINSGYTTFSMLDEYIVVYREEEFIKVLIHEAIHFFELDTVFRQFGVLQDYLPYKFKSDDIITEAFTDFFAINYYIIFICLYNNKKKYSDFIKVYQKQFEFIKSQAINIIQLSKVNQTNTIFNTTNVLSYFVLKYILFEIYLKHKANFLKLDKDIFNNFNIIIKLMKNFIKSVPDKKINNIPLTMTYTLIDL